MQRAHLFAIIRHEQCSPKELGLQRGKGRREEVKQDSNAACFSLSVRLAIAMMLPTLKQFHNKGQDIE